MQTARDRGEPKDSDPDQSRRRDDHENWQPDDADRAPTRNEDDRGHQRDQAQPQPHRPSMLPSLLITAVVALISGVIGAMGYAYLSGSKPGEASSSHTKSEAGFNQESSSTTRSGGGSNAGSAQESSTQSSTSPSMQGSSSGQDADTLKEQITKLNRRIDRLGEAVDRLQQLLSLAVPLLQRIAPKNE